jgi:hypothetical protein
MVKSTTLFCCRLDCLPPLSRPPKPIPATERDERIREIREVASKAVLADGEIEGGKSPGHMD